MALLATAAFGLSGLIMILIMQLMTMQSYAVDSVDKHGISQVQVVKAGRSGSRNRRRWFLWRSYC